MGVAPTGAIFRGLTFDGESSKDYGIYITGSAVFNAPARDVEMVTIPGRNGTFALDRGRFENIEVTYPAGLFGDTEADFAQGISDFRNFLASRQGYVELTDEYNPGEYRLAVYKNGLDVTPEQLKAGEFEIVFECKPQRYLTSGDTEETILSGDDISNPTLFDAHPLLEVWGYGDIDLGGQTVTINHVPIGPVTIASSDEGGASNTITFDSTLLNNGDTIMVRQVDFTLLVKAPTGRTFTGDGSFSVNPYFTPYGELSAGGYWNVFASYDTQTFIMGTASNVSTVFYGNYDLTDGTTNVVTYNLTYSYDGNDTFTISAAITPGTQTSYASVRWSEVAADSTMSALGSPSYIDLDIGEAYMVSGTVYTSINNAVELGSVLPVLPPGDTTITFPGTVTQLKIIPRWWKV